VPGDERASQAAGLGVVTPALADGPITILGLMPNASNATLLVRCGDPPDDELAVYKPERGESPLWDFPDGTLHRREVAAYEVSRALGWPSIPATVLRDGPEGPGSLQRFVAFDPNEHAFTLEATHPATFRLIAVFDLVVNNADRKAGHCLLGDDGTIWVIDHGVCFSEEPKLRTVLWDYVGDPLPDEAVDALPSLVDDLAPDADLGRRLGSLLGAAEVEATRERARALVADPVFPAPDPSMRPFPWPPI
jgi:uncharacterized repeat protein (TIGR03843 family)